MRYLTAVAILAALCTGAQARPRNADPSYPSSPPPLVVAVGPPPFGDPYAAYIPVGPNQLGSPWHTLCGFTIVTSCWQESPYGP